MRKEADLYYAVDLSLSEALSGFRRMSNSS